MKARAGRLTLHEIREQPEVVSRLVARQAESITPLARRLRRRRLSGVVLAARGTSDNAALYGRYLIETMLAIPVSLAAPSVSTMYAVTLALQYMLVIGLSQSGESPDIVQFLEMARRAGAFTVAVTNHARSAIARVADEVLPLHAGVERSVAATKTYTAQLTVLSLLVAAIADDRALARAHAALPGLLERALEGANIEGLLTDLGPVDRCLVTSRGYNFATARETALKLKETSRIAAEALSSADLLHGPIAMIERQFPVLVFAPPGAMVAHLEAFTLFSGRALPVIKRMRADLWTKSLVMEALGPLPVAGWAVHADPEVELPDSQRTEGTVRYRLARTVTLNPGERAVTAFYIGVGREADGARTTAADLRRRGWKVLLAETQAWLQARQVSGDGVLAEIYHRNLFFNRFFACGRTIDTDEFVWVTSRSPRYYVSAAFWSRDAFLWSLPGLLLADPKAARDALIYACRTQWRNAGMHAQYLDGTVIYPGFELDEFAAFAVGLGTYLRAAADLPVFSEAGVNEVVHTFAGRLTAHAAACGLYATFLDPSDDPVRYPYLTYDNVLAWRGLLDIAEICRQQGWTAEGSRAREMAAALQEAIWRHCVVEGPGGSMFAWAVDGEGQHELYDNPAGSLLLLPYYGFCAADHPAYLRTAAWIRSEQNPVFIPGGFAAPASVHSPDPWPMAITNDLLLDRLDGLAWLVHAEMDGRVACETVDRETGRVNSGGAFATFAGLLAAALFRHRHRWIGSI